MNASAPSRTGSTTTDPIEIAFRATAPGLLIFRFALLAAGCWAISAYTLFRFVPLIQSGIGGVQLVALTVLFSGWFFVLGALIAGAALLYAWWRHYAPIMIVVDHAGLRREVLQTVTFLAWPDITSAQLDANWIVLRTGRSRVSVNPDLFLRRDDAILPRQQLVNFIRARRPDL
jgi:hypothetical protein